MRGDRAGPLIGDLNVGASHECNEVGGQWVVNLCGMNGDGAFTVRFASILLRRGGTIGDQAPVIWRDDLHVIGCLEIGLVEACKHALGVGSFKLRVEVNLTIGRIFKAVQTFTGARVDRIGFNNDRVFAGDQVLELNAFSVVVFAAVEADGFAGDVSAVEFDGSNATGAQINEGTGSQLFIADAVQGMETNRGGGAEGLSSRGTGPIGDIEHDVVVVYRDECSSLASLVPGEVSGAHVSPLVSFHYRAQFYPARVGWAVRANCPLER